jgi:hypothetical protein
MNVPKPTASRSQFIFPPLSKFTPLHAAALALIGASATMNASSAVLAQSGLAVSAVALVTALVSDAFKATLPLVAARHRQRTRPGGHAHGAQGDSCRVYKVFNTRKISRA